MKEEFGPVPGYEGLYEVSNHGRIKSIRKNRLIRPFVNSGYSLIALSVNGKRKNYSVHRLVALVFIPNPNNYPCVNHIDSNRGKNNVENLEWCTNLMNSHHAVKQGRHHHGSTHTFAKLDDEKVREIKTLLDTHSQGEIARMFNVAQTTIFSIKKGMTWKHVE